MALPQREPERVRGLILLSLPASEGDHKTMLGFRMGPSPGGGDTTASKEEATRLAGLRPEWKLRVLPGVRHHPLFEAPNDRLEFIEAFLTRTWGRVP